MPNTVLVVEDDVEINELLGEYLALESMSYLQATTGQGAIHQALTEHPAAVILDLMLPDIDGFEVARTLSTRRATYDIPIVILSCMCQEADRQKGFASGAMYYVNKPFFPDDLISTLKRAFEWKESLNARPPMGAVILGEENNCDAAKSAHQMVSDIFAQTELGDQAVAQIREVVETLGQWAREWNRLHQAATRVRLDYKVDGRETRGGEVEWKLSESAPGMLAEAFFKPVSSGTGAGLIGWGGNMLVAKPPAAMAPPSAWMQVLAKAGAARFEKDSKAQTVRFVRPAGGASPDPKAVTVPVVEIDGTRYPTRLREEALAAKRK